MRRWVQLSLLGMFVVLLGATSWSLPGYAPADLFLRIDPLLSLQAVIASRAWVPAAGFGLFMLLSSLVLGRWFCGWMCPLGTVLEVGDDLLFRKKRRRWRNHERRFRWVKYLLLIIIALAAVFGVGLAYLADPIAWITRIFTYALWPLGSAAVALLLDAGRPVFEWFGWMGLARTEISQPVFGGLGVASLAFVALLLWLGRYQRRFWCRNLCPLGAMLAIPARFSLFRRRVGAACDNDGKCGRTCETGAIYPDHQTYDPAECIMCRRCVPDCHLAVTDFAPTLDFGQMKASTDVSRRQTISALGGATVAAAWLNLNPDRKLVSDGGLRPPGALPESSFLATCIRCGQCVKACPTNCLQSSLLQTGAAGFMTPVAVMRIGPCDPNCTACGRVCPTDALRPIDEYEKPYAKIGNAVLEKGRCLAWEQDRPCLVCDENCPWGAIFWEETPRGRRPVVDEARCNGCGQCEAACPVEGVSAIRVLPAGQIRLAAGSYRQEAANRGLILKPKPNDTGEGEGGGGEYPWQ